MEVTIGRDQQSRRLTVVRDGKVQFVGQPGSVPMDVSRQHASFTLQKDDTWELRNLNARNVTFVNGMAVEKKIVSDRDKIELGSSHYLVSWEVIKGPKVETVDVRPLKRIWEWYEDTQLELKEGERRTQNWQRLGGILSTCGMLVMFAEGLGNVRFFLMAIAALIAIFFFVRGFSPDSSLNLKMNELGKEFRKRYTCPKCGHFMGNEPYDVLIQNESCRYCRAKFIK